MKDASLCIQDLRTNFGTRSFPETIRRPQTDSRKTNRGTQCYKDVPLCEQNTPARSFDRKTKQTSAAAGDDRTLRTTCSYVGLSTAVSACVRVLIVYIAYTTRDTALERRHNARNIYYRAEEAFKQALHARLATRALVRIWKRSGRNIALNADAYRVRAAYQVPYTCTKKRSLLRSVKVRRLYSVHQDVFRTRCIYSARCK